jgi:hypothetical protein
MAQRIDVPGMGIVEFPDGMSDDQISAAIRQNMPQQAAPQAMSNEQADPVLDVAKSAGANLGRGVIDVLGAPGDIGSLAARGAEAVGVPEGARKFAGKALNMSGLSPAWPLLPLSLDQWRRKSPTWLYLVSHRRPPARPRKARQRSPTPVRVPRFWVAQRQAG